MPVKYVAVTPDSKILSDSTGKQLYDSKRELLETYKHYRGIRIASITLQSELVQSKEHCVSHYQNLHQGVLLHD